MSRWPTVDRALRRRLLDEVRRRHNVEASEASPAQRVASLDDLVALLRSLERVSTGGRSATSSDEPPELWLRMKMHFRQIRGRG
jgi:hypothetical protein